MKQNRKHNHNRICRLWSAILMIALVMLTVTWQPITTLAAESQTGTEQSVTTEKKDIVIEVVEDIPADTIEDESVPLAATPATATHTGVRVMIPVAAVIIIALTWLFSRNRRARAEVRMYGE
jgi:hypothetical protein